MRRRGGNCAQWRHRDCRQHNLSRGGGTGQRSLGAQRGAAPRAHNTGRRWREVLVALIGEGCFYRSEHDPAWAVATARPAAARSVASVSVHRRTHAARTA